MSRDFIIHGQSMISVKGPGNSSIPLLTQLGLTADAITVSFNFQHEDLNVNAWGGRIPPELQYMLADATLSMNLIHTDRVVLDECLRLSQAGGGGPGTGPGVFPAAGARMGNNLPRFGFNPATQVANNFIGLNIQAPVAQGGARPWRFLFAYLAATPASFPVGAEKSIIPLNWRCIPYTQDPWQGGAGSLGQVLYDGTLDS